jgi:hypothetical protein
MGGGGRMKQRYKITGNGTLQMVLNDKYQDCECIYQIDTETLHCTALCAGFELIEQTKCPVKCEEKSEICKEFCQGTVIYYQVKICNGRVIDLESEE